MLGRLTRFRLGRCGGGVVVGRRRQGHRKKDDGEDERGGEAPGLRRHRYLKRRGTTNFTLRDFWNWDSRFHNRLLHPLLRVALPSTMWKKLKKLGGMVAGKGDKAEHTTITAGAGNNRRDEHVASGKAAADPQAPSAMRT